jgi:biotin carboxylase
MKDLIARAGIRVPRYRAVDAPSDLLGFVGDVGLPVVVKPRSGAGSVDTQLIRDDAQLAACLAGLRANTGGLSMELIVEEFIRGQLHHINGYATADGRIGLIWPASYMERGNLDAMSEGCVFGEFLIEADDPRVPAMNAFSEACLRALPWPEHGFAFHLEAFETDDRHELVLCEVASRHGGGTINELYRFGFGVSMAEASLRMQAGLALPAHATRPRLLTGGVHAPLRTGRLSLATGEAPPFPWILNYDIKLKSGDSATGPKTCVDASANFIVKGSSTREVVDHMVQASQWFDQVASWEGQRPDD